MRIQQPPECCSGTAFNPNRRRISRVGCQQGKVLDFDQIDRFVKNDLKSIILSSNRTLFIPVMPRHDKPPVRGDTNGFVKYFRIGIRS